MQDRELEYRRVWRNLILAGCLNVRVMALAMAGHLYSSGERPLDMRPEVFRRTNTL